MVCSSIMFLCQRITYSRDAEIRRSILPIPALSTSVRLMEPWREIAIRESSVRERSLPETR